MQEERIMEGMPAATGEVFNENEAAEIAVAVEKAKEVQYAQNADGNAAGPDMMPEGAASDACEPVDSALQEHLYGLVLQGASIKSEDPAFDLLEEMKNPLFVQLTQPGLLSVREAYEFIHRDRLRKEGSERAMRQAALQIANSMAARNNRPAEPGSAGWNGGDIRRDPHRLTKEEREEIRKRVNRGEDVRF